MTVPVESSIHSTCVALASGWLGWTGLRSTGVLLLGPSASGKSDLALRLIDRGARLIADDRVVLSERRGRLIATSPPSLRGLIEIRGLGVVPMRRGLRASIALSVRLVAGPAIERMPDPLGRFDWGTVSVPMIDIDPFHASSPAKIETAVRTVRHLGRLEGGQIAAMQSAPS